MNSDNPPKIKVFTLFYTERTNSISPHVAYIDNTLEGLRKILNCHYVTCTEIEVEGQRFDVWSDDEALLVQKPVPNLYLSDDLILFGNLVFAKHDDEGAIIGVSSPEAHLLWNFAKLQAVKMYNYFRKRR